MGKKMEATMWDFGSRVKGWSVNGGWSSEVPDGLERYYNIPKTENQME